jgi:hypothetical protein
VASILAEPPLLRRSAYVGIGLIVVMSVVGFAAGSRWGPWNDGLGPSWDRPEAESACGGHDRPWARSTGIHKKQREAWLSARKETCRQWALSLTRISRLEDALTDQEGPTFAEARERLEQERVVETSLRARAERLLLRSPSSEVPKRTGLLLLDMVVVLLARWLLLSTGRWCTARSEEVFEGWARPYVGLVAFGFAVAVATTASTAFFQTSKTWVSWDSFVVSPLAWGAGVSVFLGLCLVFAWPMTILYCLGRKENVPARLDLTHPDGMSGVGLYVRFLHLWTMLVLGIPLVITIGWVRFADGGQTSFDSIYLAPVLAGAATNLLLGGRLVRNALILRHRYEDERAMLGTTWAEVGAKKPAPDPTVAFLGENWWRLPATFAGMFAGLWAVLEWARVAQIISAALR